jgi:tRNA threonylcarbamoyladenosine biosynthesis protein TsaB
VLILAFDTATDVATSALVDDGEVLGERVSRPVTLLEDVDALLRQAGARPGAIDGLAVGIGPGSFTSTRIGIAYARGLGLTLDIPAAGVSTLDALAAGAPGAYPVIDARRRQVFVRGPEVVPPGDVAVPSGWVAVGDGARRYREVLEAVGANVVDDLSELHLPSARHHAHLASDFRPVEELEPVYVREPDAVPTAARRREGDVAGRERA